MRSQCAKLAATQLVGSVRVFATRPITNRTREKKLRERKKEKEREREQKEREREEKDGERNRNRRDKLENTQAKEEAGTIKLELTGF